MMNLFLPLRSLLIAWRTWAWPHAWVLCVVQAAISVIGLASGCFVGMQVIEHTTALVVETAGGQSKQQVKFRELKRSRRSFTADCERAQQLREQALLEDAVEATRVRVSGP